MEKEFRLSESDMLTNVQIIAFLSVQNKKMDIFSKVRKQQNASLVDLQEASLLSSTSQLIPLHVLE